MKIFLPIILLALTLTGTSQEKKNYLSFTGGPHFTQGKVDFNGDNYDYNGNLNSRTGFFFNLDLNRYLSHLIFFDIGLSFQNSKFNSFKYEHTSPTNGSLAAGVGSTTSEAYNRSTFNEFNIHSGLGVNFSKQKFSPYIKCHIGRNLLQNGKSIIHKNNSDHIYGQYEYKTRNWILNSTFGMSYNRNNNQQLILGINLSNNLSPMNSLYAWSYRRYHPFKIIGISPFITISLGL